MISVASSAISAVGYEASTKQMVILFTSGESFTFSRVPKKSFSGLLDSESKGKYYESHIRNRYRCRQGY